MKFLITGGAGFIGSNYLHYVVNKYPEDYFVCLDALTYAGNYNNIKELETKDNYEELINILGNRHIYILLTTKEAVDIFKNYSKDNVTLINFYNELDINKDTYLLKDERHLTSIGNKALARVLNNALKDTDK